MRRSAGPHASDSTETPCSNDAFDSLTGVDSDAYKPESLANLTGLGAPPLIAASLLALLLGVRMLLTPILACGSRLPGYLFLAAIACGYVYQGPPFRCAQLGRDPVCDQQRRLASMRSCGPSEHRSANARASVLEYTTRLPQAAQLQSLPRHTWRAD